MAAPVLALAAIGVAGQLRRTHREAAQRAASEKFAAAHPCVHNARLTVETPDAPSLCHVVVWLTGAASPEAAEIRRFWAETAWVPTARAGWFADLAARGWPGVRR